MTSLSQQLASLQQATATVALDRKKRSKIHSVSLIYEPKYAATQDYEEIYEDAIEAFRELCTLDHRIGAFSDSIFSESSIRIDRLVQTKEQNEDLDKTVAAFLALVSPYFNLSITLRAVEWLVRRFQINVHSAEKLILCSLPFFEQPVFLRVLNVVTQFPAIFQFFEDFKKAKLDKPPSKQLIFKHFRDLQLFQLYTNHFQDLVSKKIDFQQLFVFYISISLATISSLNKSFEFVDFVPIVLEVSSTLLASGDSAKITAYTILAVLSTAIPLSKDVLIAVIDTILSYSVNEKGMMTICKLYQTLQAGATDAFSTKLTRKFSKHSAALLPMLKSQHNSNLLTALLSSLITYDLDSQLVQDLVAFKVMSGKQISIITASILAKINESTDPAKYAQLIKNLLAQDEQAVLNTINATKSVSWLEMKLQTVILDQTEDEDVSMEEEEIVVAEEEEEFSVLLEDFSPTSESFFTTNRDDVFKLYLKAIESNLVPMFDNVFQTVDSKVSFYLSVALVVKLPLKVRMSALRSLQRIISKDNLNFYPLAPIILALLADSKDVIRTYGANILKLIKTKQTPKLKLIATKISSEDVSLLAPNDGIAFVNRLVETVDDCTHDETAVYKIVSGILADKKLGKLVMLTLVSYAQLTSVPSVKATLFHSIVAAKGTSSLFESFFNGYIASRHEWEKNCEKQGFNFRVFEESVFGLVSAKDKSVLKLLLDSLSSISIQLSEIAQAKIVSIFGSLKFESQVQIIQYIIDHSQDDVNFDPVGLLQSLRLTNPIFVRIFKDSSLNQFQLQSSESPAVPKRRRRSSASTRAALKDQQVSKIAVEHLEQLTVMFQALEYASATSLEPSFELLQLLFDLLDELETLGNDGKLAVYYSQEVLANCMLNVINKLTSAKSKPSSTLSVRADVVISSIRSSSSPQVQNRLLLVMAGLATLSPETVLHSVMPIFTFMGAHTIRQDDEFSSHVLEKTVQCVVPALAKNAKDGQIKDEIEFLMASFVSAFHHIPKHRRVYLFKNLANTLGEENSLHLVTLLCAQHYYFATEHNKNAESRSLVEFVSQFLSGFSAKTQLTVVSEFLKIWKSIPTTQLSQDDELVQKIAARPVFDSSIVLMSTEELTSLRATLISFLHECVTTNPTSDISSLKLSIVSLFLSNSSATKDVLKAFGNDVELLLEILQTVSNEESSKFISESLYSLLEDLLDAVPILEFVEAIVPIISETETSKVSVATIRNVTVLASTKFGQESADDLNAQQASLSLLPVLLANIEKSSGVEVSQASLNTLGSLVRKFNDNLDSKLLIECLSVVTSEYGFLNKASPEIVISAINSITSIVSVLGVKAIGYLPKFIQPAFDIFNSTLTSENESAPLIQSSILALFGCCVRKLSAFIAPNLKDILKAVFDASLVSEATKSAVLALIVQSIDIKTVIVSLCSLWKHVSASKDASSVGLFLYGMEMTVTESDKKTAAQQASGFFKFFQHALEYRANCDFDTNTIYRIESSLYQCGIQYVMKLNDKNFRPLFAGLVRWAFDAEGVISEITEIERLESFFRFFNKLQDSLKSIITGYYSYFFDPTVELLGKFTSGDVKNITLRRVVLISLATSFKYDQDEHWQAEARFGAVSKALFDQLVNIEEPIAKYLVKAITSLCQACATDTHNRTINDLMLQHIRSECKPREKFWAVRTMKTIYQKVGESWLGLLPQLVPLIAELLEDENEEVEMEVRKGLVRVIETVMGEPLDRYLE